MTTEKSICNKNYRNKFGLLGIFPHKQSYHLKTSKQNYNIPRYIIFTEWPACLETQENQFHLASASTGLTDLGE